MSDPILLEIVERLRSRFYGKYRGTVTEVGDDGRIKAKVPAVLGDTPTGWCMPCLPYAGKDTAIAFLPEQDAGVWIEFEGGDVSYPIWVGCYWHDGDKPSRVAPKIKVIKTVDHEIVLDDNNHSITITDSNHSRVTLDRDGIAIVRGDTGPKGKVAVTEGKVSVNDGAMEVT
jgi:hypothetical protein